MNSKVSVLFYAKKSKTKSNAKVPIYLRITVNGKRAECSTGKDVDINKWNVAASRLKGNSEDARTINKYLDALHSRILVIEKNLCLSNESFDASDVKNILEAKHDAVRYLVPIFQDHNSRMEKLIGKEYAIATLKNYRTCLSHLKQFLWSFYKKADIEVGKLSISFLNEFDFYLRTTGNCNNNSAVKH
ncbi:phage integrase SAM-like domain-containing protein, partial [Soonwooa sp.]|uniref:phage integrase SAM-like domain-containing protein n=1 Tax=Soonwooa sp. TaxID=1938592 RepID=UPI00289ED0D4